MGILLSCFLGEEELKIERWGAAQLTCRLKTD